MIPTPLAPLKLQLSRLLGLPSDVADEVVAQLQEVKAGFSFAELEETAIPSYTHRLSPIRYLFLKRLQVALSLLHKQMDMGRDEPDAGKSEVLDFGCGAGLMTIALQLCDYNVFRCDIRPAVCLPLAQDSPSVDAETSLQSHADFTRFSACVALDVLEHLTETELDAFTASFRSGAILIVSGPTENWLYRLGRRLAGFQGGYHQRDVYQILYRFEQSGWTRAQRDRVVLSRFYCPAFVVACLSKQ